MSLYYVIHAKCYIFNAECSVHNLILNISSLMQNTILCVQNTKNKCNVEYCIVCRILKIFNYCRILYHACRILKRYN